MPVLNTISPTVTPDAPSGWPSYVVPSLRIRNRFKSRVEDTFEPLPYFFGRRPDHQQVFRDRKRTLRSIRLDQLSPRLGVRANKCRAMLTRSGHRLDSTHLRRLKKVNDRAVRTNQSTPDPDFHCTENERSDKVFAHKLVAVQRQCVKSRRGKAFDNARLIGRSPEQLHSHRFANCFGESVGFCAKLGIDNLAFAIDQKRARDRFDVIGTLGHHCEI